VRLCQSLRSSSYRSRPQKRSKPSGGEAGPHEVSYAQLLGALNEARGLEEEVWASVEELFLASGGVDME